MTQHETNDPNDQTLYDALGGEEVVRESVKDLYRRVLDDEELAPFFKHASMERLRRMQTELISSMLDGPVNYTGNELSEVHRGRGISTKHFSKFCRHLADAMEDRGVEEQVIDQVLGRLALYSDLITGSTNVDG